MGFEPTIADSELPEGEMQGVVVRGRNVLLVRVDGKVCAYADKCAHNKVQLSEGQLVGNVLMCWAHQYTYDVRTGAGIKPEHTRLEPFAVDVRNGLISIDIGRRP